MKKISKKKNLLTKTSLGVVAASLVMTPIVTAVACGTDAPAPVKPIDPPYKTINTFKGKFSTPEKEQAFLNITDEVPNDAFMNETELESITLPDVTTIGKNAFAMDAVGDGNKLIEINLPKVLTIKYNAFHNSNVDKINFPSVRKLGRELFSATKLTSITLPKIKIIEDSTFEKYRNVVELNLPSVTEIGVDAFDGMNNLKTISLPEVKEIKSGAFRVLFNDTEIISLPKIEIIGNGSFNGRIIQGAISLPMANEIRVGAFYNAQFTSIDLPLLTKINSVTFQNSPFNSLKIPKLTNINQIDSILTFYGAVVNAEVFVSDVSYWTNTDQTFQIRLREIFGPNFASIQWKQYTS